MYYSSETRLVSRHVVVILMPWHSFQEKVCMIVVQRLGLVHWAASLSPCMCRKFRRGASGGLGMRALCFIELWKYLLATFEAASG